METRRIIELKERLLQRRIAGEIDQPEYLQMLAEIEHLSDTASQGRERMADSPSGTPRRSIHDSIGDAPTSSAELQAGCEIGKYRLAERLGAGGMGEVWKAWDGIRDVVLKFLPRQLQASPEEIARVKETFLRIHALQHQHICPTYDVSDAPDTGVFLVMKFVDGQTLSAYRRAYVRQHGGFPVSEVVRLLRPVAAALDYAHTMRVVHRDIKPQNILVGRDGVDVQLVDFGLAAEIRDSVSRISQTQMGSTGTYAYMAPEQWRGRFQDGRTDQYALGVVAYELIAGELPFQAPDAFMLRQCALNEQPARIPDISSSVNDALATALAKDRSKRFDGCVQFVGALAEQHGESHSIRSQDWSHEDSASAVDPITALGFQIVSDKDAPPANRAVDCDLVPPERTH